MAKIANKNKPIAGIFEANENFDPNKYNYDKITNNDTSNILSQTDICAFCDKLLDILKNGDIPLQTQSDKYQYLKPYFEVKSKIAKIQNILLVREIYHRYNNKNKDKDNKQGLYADNEQKIQKQKEELELVINANYLAFQSSIEDYKQLKKEIENIKSDLKKDKNNDAINENNNQYEFNIINVEDKMKIMGQLKEIEKQIKKENFEQKEGTLKNDDNEFFEDADKKTLETQKHLLTKKLELCILKDCIKQQIDGFIDVFSCSKEDGKLNEVEMEKKNIVQVI